jgi:hypothetical protein
MTYCATVGETTKLLADIATKEALIATAELALKEQDERIAHLEADLRMVRAALAAITGEKP